MKAGQTRRDLVGVPLIRWDAERALEIGNRKVGCSRTRIDVGDAASLYRRSAIHDLLSEGMSSFWMIL